MTMLNQSRNHQIITSKSSRMMSMFFIPAYVLLAMLSVWTLNLHRQLQLSKQQHSASNMVSQVNVDPRHRTKRSPDSATNTFLNMLPGTEQQNVLYDMELEPCGGAVFTVWGRSVCPEETNAELVYDGVVGGTNTDSHGGGVDYLCLSRHPQWKTTSSSALQKRRASKDAKRRQSEQDAVKETKKPCTSTTTTSAPAPTSFRGLPRPRTPSGEENHAITRDELMRLLMGKAETITSTSRPETEKDAYLYGTEYQVSEVNFRRDNLAADTFVDQDAVCAVCRSHLRLSVVMIPGRRECYAGWTKEYEGFLMTGPVGAPSQHRFVCLHSAPEAAQGGFRKEAGAVFYHVRAMCGSLPCPTYIQDKEVTCVVCTK